MAESFLEVETWHYVDVRGLLRFLIVGNASTVKLTDMFVCDDDLLLFVSHVVTRLNII